MPTITAGTVATVYCPLASTITITPGSAGRVSFQSRAKDGGQSAAPQEVYSATTVSVSAGDTVTMEAINTDATYTTPAGGDDNLSALAASAGAADAVVAAYEAGMLAVPAGTRLGTIASVPTASILLDAGSGGTVTTARVTFAPPTDTIGAQRLHTPTAETYTLTMDSALDVTLGDLNGIALVMHAIGVSTDAVLTGESYVAESDYTLAEYIAGDARFEWLDSTPTRVRLTLQRGSSTRYATLSVVAEVSA